MRSTFVGRLIREVDAEIANGDRVIRISRRLDQNGAREADVWSLSR
jgi:hypothetical protein